MSYKRNFVIREESFLLHCLFTEVDSEIWSPQKIVIFDLCIINRNHV